MLLKQLQKIGLNENEAKVYLSSLELGETTIQRIAKKAGIKRTTAYGIIESLKNKGLIVSSKNKKKNLYYAENPRKLEDNMEQKMEIFKSLLPQMLSITNLIDNKPKIRFFEGEEEIKEIYKDTLNYPAGKILIWISEAVFKKIDRLFFDNFYTPRRIKNKIAVRAIVSDNSVAKKFQSEGGKFLRQTKIDKINDIQIESEIMLYGNKNIAIISVDEIMGFVIESPKMFRTLRAIFEIHWASIQDNNLL